MKFHFSSAKGKKKGISILVSVIVFLIFVNLNNFSNSTLDTSIGEQNADSFSDLNKIKEPKVAANEPNGKPLLVYQHSTITKTFYPFSLPYDISFTLVEGWTSKNVTISYDGVAHKKNWVVNGSFDEGETPWVYNSSNSAITNMSWQPTYVEIKVISQPQDIPKGSSGYFEQNFTIPETLTSDTLVTLSTNYKYRITGGIGVPSRNISAFISINIGGIEKNKSISFSNLVEGSANWNPMTLPYYMSEVGQQLPGNITIRAGVFVDNITDTPNKDQFLSLDDIQFTVWTKPNLPNLLIANDTDDVFFYNVYNYTNSSYGEGSAFIDESIRYSEDTEIVFTILKNSTFTEDFKIDNITIASEAVKIFNTTAGGKESSQYTNGININWQTECSIDLLHYTYLHNWAEINKPNDWNITSVLYGSYTDYIANCTGTGLGSEKLIIPEEIFSSGTWTLKANSQNYISNGSLVVGPTYNEKSNITMGEPYRINVGLYHTLDLTNTQINCTIEYPNGTIFYQNTSIPNSNEMNFGTHTVGKNMTVGTYQVLLEWTNNQTYLSRDKVGFLQFEFDVWHHTNLTAVNPLEVKVSGEPYLMKVNFTDYDSNTYIDFATVTFISINSTGHLMSFGTMIYFGSGFYVYDLDLSDLELGDYYFFFNTTNRYYENQSIRNLINLTIISQPLTLEVPHEVINVDANSYATCYINVTGSITGTLIPGAINITTDWYKNFTVTGNDIAGNGIVYLNFSTYQVPTQGIVETFTVTIFANKTNFGSTSAFISLTVNPIPAIVNVNETIIDAYLNSSFSLKINYTIESSDEIIQDAALNVIWASTFNVLPVVDGYFINFSTTNLSLEIYSIFFQLSHPGYETGYSSVYVNILPKSTYVEIFLDQVDKTSDKTLTMPWNNPLNITILYKESISNQFISGASIELNGAGLSELIPQIQQQYTLILNQGELPIGIHFLTITSQKENYDRVPIILRITVEQIEVQVDTLEFNGTIDVFAGASQKISFFISEAGSGSGIENADVTYSWNFQFGSLFENMGNGIYEANLSIPSSALGAYTIEIIIRNEEAQYRDRNFLVNIYVSKIEIQAYTLDFNGTLDLFTGDSQLIRIFLGEAGSESGIEGANVTYSWDFADGVQFENMGNGIYEAEISIPNSALGAYSVEIFIRNEELQYRDRNFLVNIYVSQKTTPNYTIWVIVIALLSVIGVLSTLSVRSYVILPRKRKKERIFQNTIQVFKDVKNIQSVMLIQRNSGMPFFNKNYANFDTRDNSLLSGFIQAITIFGEQMINGAISEDPKKKSKEIYSKNIIELNFKYFHLLICDYQSVRSLLILREHSSERLKRQFYLLSVEIDAKLGNKIENFSGNLTEFESNVDILLNEFLSLYYSEPYRLIKDASYMQFLKKSRELKSIEARILNVIIARTKLEKEFTLNNIVEEIDEKNVDAIYGGLHTLVARNIIVPIHYKKKDSHPLLGGFK